MKVAITRLAAKGSGLGNHNYPWYQRDKNYDKLRSDPEYQRIMEEVRRHWEKYKQTFSVA